MLNFLLISEFNKPVAVLVDNNPNPAQLTTLFSLLPENAFSFPDLAARWEVAFVLCNRDWRAAQLKRQPMLKPKGIRMGFLIYGY